MAALARVYGPYCGLNDVQLVHIVLYTETGQRGHRFTLTEAVYNKEKAKGLHVYETPKTSR